MPRKLILTLLTFLAIGMLSAQQPWSFATVEEACRDDAYLILPPDSLRGEVLRASHGKADFNVSYHVSGPYRSWGRRSVRFQNADADFSVSYDLAERLLPYMVSHSYWRTRFERWSAWSFVDMTQVTSLIAVDTTDRRYGNYSPLMWQGFAFQPSEEWPVVFTILTNTGQPQTVTLRAVERLAKWGAFSTFGEWKAGDQRDRQRRQREADRADSLQRQLDSLAGIGLWARRQADSLLTAMQSDSLAAVAEQSRAEVERAKARMNRDEIFLMNIKPAHSDYMFGLEYNFYNCFSKTITKVEITIVPYNSRGRVQEDKFHRSVRTVRCMGPIYPGSPAPYLFDELFWDDQGRIKYMRTTNVTFYFTDGTTRSYAGYDKVMKHVLK